jgi:hypothetical protein
MQWSNEGRGDTRPAACADERGPVVLGEAELTQIAAAGSKPGAANVNAWYFPPRQW